MCQVEEHKILSFVGRNDLNQLENVGTSNIFISFLFHTYMRINQINPTINCLLQPLLYLLVLIRSIVKQLFGSLASVLSPGFIFNSLWFSISTGCQTKQSFRSVALPNDCFVLPHCVLSFIILDSLYLLQPLLSVVLLNNYF